MENWRDNVKGPLKVQLEKVIKNSAEHRDTIQLASDKKTAQLWIAIAHLSKELREQKVRTKYMETILTELLETKKAQLKSKKQKEDLDKLIKTLKKF